MSSNLNSKTLNPRYNGLMNDASKNQDVASTKRYFANFGRFVLQTAEELVILSAVMAVFDKLGSRKMAFLANFKKQVVSIENVAIATAFTGICEATRETKIVLREVTPNNGEIRAPQRNDAGKFTQRLAHASNEHPTIKR